MVFVEWDENERTAKNDFRRVYVVCARHDRVKKNGRDNGNPKQYTLGEKRKKYRRKLGKKKKRKKSQFFSSSN